MRALGLLLLLPLLAGCATSRAASGPPRVVAAENVWGSIAAQIGGARASVTSIVAGAGTDPHDYAPSAGDARALARAGVAIVNGAGYDPWATQLLAANPVTGRVVVDAGKLVGLRRGDNPHAWYDPADVRTVAGAIAHALGAIDPKDASYFTARARRFESVSLAAYDHLRARVRTRYAGVPVGYSESVFAPLGADLHLRLATPSGFAKAVAEGAEPSAQDERAVEAQVRAHAIRVWVYNSQNATPDVRRVNALCALARIPVVAVTETLSPAGATFEAWQVAQLRALTAALHEATGR